jgi:hypothetical protein
MREAHLGAPRAATVTRRWLAMAIGLLQASATAGGGSKDRLVKRSRQVDAARCPKA